MFWEILLAIIIGVHAGTLTGLTPGIHVNLITAIVVSASLIIPASPIAIACFIIALAITHSFIDSIPSIYLGAPDADQALSVLPGHRMLHQGKGHLAIKMTIIGSLMALVLGVLAFPLILRGMGWAYPLVKGYIAYLLIAVMAYMILREKGLGKIFALLVFLLSGALGWSLMHPWSSRFFHYYQGFSV